MLMLNAISSNKPIALFIGRKKQIIKEPFRLEMSQEITDTSYLDAPMQVVTSQRMDLFIADKLFASIKTPPRVRYARRSVTIVKPKRGPMQIHLLKKATVLAPFLKSDIQLLKGIGTP